MWEWNERSRKCETYNHCDQASDVNVQQYNVCVTECSEGMEFDENMQRCMCPPTHYYYIDHEQYEQYNDEATGESGEATGDENDSADY